ncbi:MAG: ribosomal L7Ae/L30e/S12e/Gadd45 family protein [Candidatus Cloacimonas sp.]|nr:ribosomal L7Ae/L30e/S12e/Gadd45 family protein [Candidatus Cloacimonadota bacterium]
MTLDEIKELLDNKAALAIGTLLGFAMKMGKLPHGMNACLQSIRSKRAIIIIIATDFSNNSRQKIEEAAIEHNVRTFMIGTKRQLGMLLGIRDVGVLALEEPNLANGLLKILA